MVIRGLPLILTERKVSTSAVISKSNVSLSVASQKHRQAQAGVHLFCRVQGDPLANESLKTRDRGPLVIDFSQPSYQVGQPSHLRARMLHQHICNEDTKKRL